MHIAQACLELGIFLSLTSGRIIGGCHHTWSHIVTFVHSTMFTTGNLYCNRVTSSDTRIWALIKVFNHYTESLLILENFISLFPDVTWQLTSKATAFSLLQHPTTSSSLIRLHPGEHYSILITQTPDSFSSDSNFRSVSTIAHLFCLVSKAPIPSVTWKFWGVIHTL